METFEFPFTSSGAGGRGALSNWWAGCESVCDMVSKLLRDGFMYSYPYNGGFGAHLFRKDIPKLVFVFSNEFDNSLSRRRSLFRSETWNDDGGRSIKYSFNNELFNVVVVPTSDGEKLTFYCDAGNSTLNSTLMAPDPYCQRILKSASRDNIDDYIKAVLPNLAPS